METLGPHGHRQRNPAGHVSQANGLGRVCHGAMLCRRDTRGKRPTSAALNHMGSRSSEAQTMQLSPPKSADELVDLYYHDMRSHLLEVAAAFDRIDRAGGTADPRLEALRRVSRIAVDDAPDRAECLLRQLSIGRE